MSQLLGILLAFIFLFSQHSSSGNLVGYVRSLANEPLADVSVYINGSTLGTMTTESGYFEINNIPFGQIQLVAQMVGFQTQNVDVLVVSEKLQTIHFKMEEKNNSSDVVEIVGLNPAEWKRLLVKFKKSFLGESPYSKNCEFVNPEVLDLKEKNNILFAKTEQPLLVLNKNTGYQIYYDINVYENKGSDIKYILNSRFEALPNFEERSRRSFFYKNSMKFFLKNLYHNTLKENGFSIGSYHRFDNKTEQFFETPNVDSILINYTFKEFKRLTFKEQLSIRHQNIDDDSWFKYTKQKAGASPYISQLRRLTNEDLIISSNGNLLYPTLHEFSGYLSYYRFSADLPRDFEPGTTSVH